MKDMYTFIHKNRKLFRFLVITLLLLCQICSISGMTKKMMVKENKIATQYELLSSDIFDSVKNHLAVKDYYDYKKYLISKNLGRAEITLKKIITKNHNNANMEPLVINENINYLLAKGEREQALKFINSITLKLSEKYPIEKLGRTIVVNYQNYQNKNQLIYSIERLFNEIPRIQENIDLVKLYVHSCKKGGDKWKNAIFILWQNSPIDEFSKKYKKQLPNIKKQSLKSNEAISRHFKVQKKEKKYRYILNEAPWYLKHIDQTQSIYRELRKLYFKILLKRREYTKLIKILSSKSEKQRFYISESEAIYQRIALNVKKGWIQKADILINKLIHLNQLQKINESYFLIGDFYFIRGKYKKSLKYLHKIELQNVSKRLLPVIQWYRYRIYQKLEKKKKLKTVVDWSENHTFVSNEVAAKFCYWSVKSKVYPEMDYLTCYQRFPYTYYGIKALRNKRQFSNIKNSLQLKRNSQKDNIDFSEKRKKFLGLLIISYAFGETEIADMMVEDYLKEFKDIKSFLKVKEVLMIAHRYYLLQKLLIPHNGKMFDSQENSFPELMVVSFPKAYENLVEKYAVKDKAPKAMVYAVMREESTFRAEVKSSAGAIGLMQLMPKTAEYVGKRIKLKVKTENLSQPDLNIRLGTAYIKRLMRQYRGNMFYTLAAYNGGGTNVKRWRKKVKPNDMDYFVEAITFIETQNYVKRVLRSYFIYESLYN